MGENLGIRFEVGVPAKYSEAIPLNVLLADNKLSLDRASISLLRTFDESKCAASKSLFNGKIYSGMIIVLVVLLSMLSL